MDATHILVATNNRHKVDEIRSFLGDGFRVSGLFLLPGITPDPETADTFEGNARIKAESIARQLREESGLEKMIGSIDWILADDSGLEVDALGGLPGVKSARFASEDTGADGNSDDGDNNAKLLSLLRDVPDGKRTARFRCCLWVVDCNGKGSGFEGCCNGKILEEMHGNKGFGYDPLFVPDGYQSTFAELGQETKNLISHRAKALGAFQDYLASS